ncbi:TPA_asm: UL28 uORF [Human alphaherpesvirus 1]|nr:TPA_asm: UL28 uORF [Human alphaherpesvirus 1]
MSGNRAETHAPPTPGLPVGGPAGGRPEEGDPGAQPDAG